MAPKTVFVVGAGASCEFDLPVGNRLKDEISRALAFKSTVFNCSVGNGDPYLFETLQTHVINVRPKPELKELVGAARRISSAMTLAPSIDNFIHVHNGESAVELCGKLAIAHRILRAESTSKLRVPDEANVPQLESVEGTWLVALMKLLCEDCTLQQLPERLSSVEFIIFNYDRCVEHFLFHAFKLYYAVHDDIAADLVNSMKIYHPYGVVGALPWQTSIDVQQSISFGGSPSQTELINIASGIKTFTEGTDDQSSDIIAIRNAMESAERIVFMGFAYHRLNVELLLSGNTLSRNRARRVFGTGFGMSKHDIGMVADSLSNRLHAPSMVVADLKCVDLFHEYNRALSFV